MRTSVVVGLASAASLCLLVGCRSDVYEQFQVDTDGSPYLADGGPGPYDLPPGDSGPPPHDALPPLVDYAPFPPPPIDGFPPPPFDGFVPPIDGFPPPPFDGFPPPIDSFPPPPDLAMPDAMPPPVDMGIVDMVHLPDGLVDLGPDGGGNPDAPSCQAGDYSGPFTGAVIGFPVKGTMDITLGPDMGGQLVVTKGTMTGTGALNSTLTATLDGTLDCGKSRFSGNITNGVITAFGLPFAFTGSYTADYDEIAHTFTNGLWLITIPRGLGGMPGAGNGTWHAP